MWKSESRGSKGQIFTLDAFFAVGIFALALGLLGSSFGELRGRVEAYWSDYSLERTANDAADALVYTCGTPTDWADRPESLKVPGVAENWENLILKCSIDLWRLAKLMEILRVGNWDSSPAKASITRMFGGERFWIRVGLREAVLVAGSYRESERVLWSFWPRWEPGQSQPPGLENASKVVVVRRPVLLRTGRLLWESYVYLEDAGTVENQFSFYLSQFEYDAFDLYIRVVSDPDPAYRIDNVSLGINEDPPRDPVADQEDGYIYENWMGAENAFPSPFPAGHWVIHGGIENDGLLKSPFSPGRNPNQLRIRVTGDANTWVLIQLIELPACSPPSLALMDLKSVRTGFLEVVLWR
jgi:hypothetical protein